MIFFHTGNWWPENFIPGKYLLKNLIGYTFLNFPWTKPGWKASSQINLSILQKITLYAWKSQKRYVICVNGPDTTESRYGTRLSHIQCHSQPVRNWFKIENIFAKCFPIVFERQSIFSTVLDLKLIIFFQICQKYR